MLTPQQSWYQHSQRLLRQFVRFVVRNVRAERLDAVVYCPDTCTQPYRIRRRSRQLRVEDDQPRTAKGFLEAMFPVRLIVCAAREIGVFAR